MPGGTGIGGSIGVGGAIGLGRAEYRTLGAGVRCPVRAPSGSTAPAASPS